MNKTENSIVIFKTEDEKISVDVCFEEETVWLTQNQMSKLFEKAKSTISEHIKHIFEEEELNEEVVVRNSRIATPHGAIKGKKQENTVKLYNLDVIISVGYRVKSLRGTQFRQWATQRLKEYLLKGVAINLPRLDQLNKTIEIISRSYIPEISGIANILQNFTKGLDLLDSYDHQNFSKPKPKNKGKWQLTYKEARNFIDSMKFGTESSLFGREKDESFKSSLGAIYQTFGGKELYPSIQEKAANLLYLIVKNHSFTDGNKRIAAALFVYFLDKNKVLINKSGQFLVDNNALAATTLMIALSRPQEKEIMCNLVLNFLN